MQTVFFNINIVEEPSTNYSRVYMRTKILSKLSRDLGS